MEYKYRFCKLKSKYHLSFLFRTRLAMFFFYNLIHCDFLLSRAAHIHAPYTSSTYEFRTLNNEEIICRCEFMCTAGTRRNRARLCAGWGYYEYYYCSLVCRPSQRGSFCLGANVSAPSFRKTQRSIGDALYIHAHSPTIQNGG